MRFAGQVFNKFSEQNDFSEADDYMKRIQGVERMRPEIQNPVVPGFNTEDLIPTPELPAGTPFNQNDKGRYIQQVPGSGISSVQGQQVALSPLLLPAHVIRGAVQGQPTGDGTLPELKGQPDPFQQRNRIRPSDSDDQLMDIMKSGFVQGPQQVEVAGIFNPFDWFNGKNQKDIDKMNSGSDEPITNQGKTGNTIMNRNRKLKQMIDGI